MKFLNYLLLLLLFNSILLGQNNEKVSLQLLWKHQFEFAGFYMAKEKGFYKDVSLEVELKEFNFGDDITKLVENEKSTFGISYSNIILDKSNGANVVLLNSIFQSSPHVLVSLNSSGINSLEDFKNKKIMIENNAIITAPLISMLYSENIKLSDMNIIKPSFNINDLINNRVDIFSAYISNEIFKLDNKNIKYTIWNPSDYGFDFYNDILFTSSKVLNNNPNLVKNFQHASLKGWEYAFNNIDETVELILAKYNTQNKTRAGLIYEANRLKELAYKNNKKLGDISKEKIQRIYDIYNLMGLTKNKIDLDTFIYKPDDKKILFTKEEERYLKSKKKINMCIDPDWMPFEKFKDGKHIGISADYFKLFQNRLNLEFNPIMTKNWTQSLQFAKDRKCDILSLVMETPERKEYLNFTEPYLKVPLIIATKIDVPFINDLGNLKDQKIGIPKGYAFVEILKNKYPKLNIHEVNNVNDGLEKVNKGELFGYIGTLASVGYLFQSKYTGELKIAGKFDETWELGIGVRDDDKILFDILQKVVQSVDSAKKQQILNNWVAINYEKSIDKKLLFYIFIIIFILISLFMYKQYILKKSIKEFNEVINATMEGILIFKEGICIDVNQSTLDIFGYTSKDEVIGKNPLEFISSESKEYVKEQFKEIEALPYEAKLIKKDGTEFYGLLRGQNLKNKNVRLSSVIDISTLKQQENVLIEQSRMVAMGEMIGNIAHQWRQPLSVISTGATGLQIQKENNILSDESFTKTCTTINENAQYLSRTIDDFRNFIKGDRKKKTFNLKENIDSFIQLVEGTIKTNHINLIYNIDNQIFVDGYPNELIQCYINIFNNAKDVLKDIQNKDRLIFFTTEEKEDSIVITMKDNGGGIPDDIILKIFDPYFTTKHKSQGTGLGLHMTYKLIKDGMNGTIVVKNIDYKYKNVNYKGAEFRIILPK